MQFTREIQRLILLFGIGFGAVALVAAYWAVIGAETISSRDDNPRVIEDLARIQRGAIYDRDGALLVESVADDNGIVTRRYRFDSTYSALGYYSLRYGEDGIESTYNSQLSGEDQPYDLESFIHEDVLHYPQQGQDIQVTLDLEIQQRAATLLNGHRGAIVVMSIPDGAIHALVSLPTYNPNMLDTNWEDFVKAEGNPFFNRALLGTYQPGSVIQIGLITAALLNNISLNTTYADATLPIEVDDVVLNCVQPSTLTELTLSQAFTYGCPAPFAAIVEQIGLQRIESVLNTFRNAPHLIDPEATPEPLTTFTLEDALGQGEITYSPLEMAAIIAAVINGGNAPQPYLVEAIKQDDIWQPITSVRPTTPIITPEISRQLQGILRLSVLEGTAQSAAQTGLDIGGQAGIGYAGDSSHVWFIGFVRLVSNQGFAVAVVIEDSDDIDLPASIGGELLALAAMENQSP